MGWQQGGSAWAKENQLANERGDFWQGEGGPGQVQDLGASSGISRDGGRKENFAQLHTMRCDKKFSREGMQLYNYNNFHQCIGTFEITSLEMLFILENSPC